MAVRFKIKSSRKKEYLLFASSLIIAILIITALLIFKPRISLTGKIIEYENPFKKSVNAQTITITEENLDLYLSSQEIIKDLPKKGAIHLKVSDNDYTIKKSSVTKGAPSEPDITISLPSTYIPYLSEGLCSTLSKANANGDLSIELHLSKAELLWKYKSFLKYKDCLS